EPPAIENPITSSSRQIFLKRVSLSLTSLKNTPERLVIAFCEGKKWKRNLWLKERKVECCESRFDVKKLTQAWKI
ncbi:MAG: hypothetical protein V3U87_02915, partial [Methylococcaceae bacterium]